MIHPAECAFTFPGRQFIISIKLQEMQGLHTALDNIIGRCKRCCEMRTSVTLKTLIIISAAMIITVLSFSMGYFKAKMDFQKFTDTYTVSVEETARPAPENETPAEQENVKSNYAYFPVVFDRYKYTRNEVFEMLKSENVIARKYFYPLTNDVACYAGYPTSGAEKTPVAKFLADRVLTLPLYADLSKEEVNFICDIILK